MALKKCKLRVAAGALAMLALLTGCSAGKTGGPEEVFVVKEGSPAEYSLTTVRQGDVALTESVRVKYFAARQKSYGFGESGYYYDTFLVSVGDEVKRAMCWPRWTAANWTEKSLLSGSARGCFPRSFPGLRRCFP